jgi:hypothetical protein
MWGPKEAFQSQLWGPVLLQSNFGNWWSLPVARVARSSSLLLTPEGHLPSLNDGGVD